MKILWDFSLELDSHHLSNRLDIVLFDYVVKKMYFIKISCPGDAKVLTKEQDKIQKYVATIH